MAAPPRTGVYEAVLGRLLAPELLARVRPGLL
jgi:hypothetical protein